MSNWFLDRNPAPSKARALAEVILVTPIATYVVVKLFTLAMAGVPLFNGLFEGRGWCSPMPSPARSWPSGCT